MRGSIKFCQGDPDFLVNNVFQRGPSGPFQRSNCTRGVHLLLEGVIISTFKETYSNCDSPGQGGLAHVLCN